MLQDAAEQIQDGKVIAFPTETVYGLGCDVYNKEAIQQLFKLKGRPESNPLLVLIATEDQLNELVREVPESARKLMKAFWPGPLTIVFKKHSRVPDIVTAGKDTVGVRLPGSRETRELISLADGPIVAPSANPSGKKPATTPEEVKEYFPNTYLVARGTCEGSLSTIVSVVENPAILREGAISQKQIQEVLSERTP